MTAAMAVIADSTGASVFRGPPGFAGYAAAMLSMAAFDIAVSGAFAAVAGRPEAVLARLPETLLLLVLGPLAAARRLYRPVSACLAGGGAPEAAAERLVRLPALSARWGALCAALFAGWSFVIAPIWLYGTPATGETLALLLSRAAAWIVLLPFVAYFLVQDHARAGLRWLHARHGVVAPPGGASLGAKLALILAGGAMAPGLSIAATVLLVPPTSPITGLPRESIVMVTLIAGGAALCVAFWSVERAINETLTGLTGALAAIRAGDTARRLPVETDDELGHLAAGFNDLGAALSASREAQARAAAERAEAATMFHEAQKQSALGQLAAGVAHDFNNILTIVMGYTQSARKRMGEDDPARARLGEVMTAAERGRALIAQILAFSRSGAPERSPLDLCACVAESVAWLRATLGAAHPIAFERPGDGLMILGEPAKVHQIVANLCINASHAMPGGGPLTVRLERVEIDGGRAEGLSRLGLPKGPQLAVETETDGTARAFVGILRAGPHARLSVSDVGRGMDAGVLRRVFEPYFTTKPAGQGSGLGLAAVHGVVGGWDGAITVASRAAPAEGHGARFDIYLPLATQPGD